MKKTFFLSLSGLMLALAAPAQHWSLTWKKLQTVSPGLEQIGLVSTASSRELANPRWSVGCECLDREYADFSAYKPYVGELGVGAARIQSGWARCEKEKGKYEFEWLDEAVDGLRGQGIRRGCASPTEIRFTGRRRASDRASLPMKRRCRPGSAM